MNKIVYYLSISLFFLLLVGCAPTDNKIVWESEDLIVEEIVVQAGEKDVSLGSLEEHKVQIYIPEDAFEKPTELALVPLSERVKVDASKLNPASSLYRFEIRGEQSRTNLPLQIEIAVDQEILQKAAETGGFRGVHYDKDFGWTYTDLVDLDPENGVVSFETYHNFFWGAAELTEEERIDDHLEKISREQFVRSQVSNELEKVTTEIVNEMLVGAFDEHNPDIARHIISEVSNELKGSLSLNVYDAAGKITEVPVGDGIGIMNDISEGDYQSLMVNIATKSGEVINKGLESGTLDVALKSTGVVAQSLGAIAAGDYRGAGEHLGNYVVDKSIVLQAGRLAIEAVDMKINNWRDSEIEKAYQIYVEGAESLVPNWGYSVDPGDFDALWGQMQGVTHKVQSDALKRHAELRGIHIDDIPQDVADQIRGQAAANLREQFEERRKQELEIAKLKEHNEYVVERFKDWQLLDRGRDYFPRDMPVEVQIDRLMGQIDRVLNDTGRTEVIYDMGYFAELEDDQIHLEDIIDAIFTNYTEGHEAYMERLIELDLLEEDLDKNLSGTWSGTSIMTEGEFHAEDHHFQAGDEPSPFEFVIKEEPEGGYTLHYPMMTKGEEVLHTFIVPVSYDPDTGTIQFTLYYEELGLPPEDKTEYTGVVLKEDDQLIMSGNVHEQMSYGYSKGNWQVQKQD